MEELAKERRRSSRPKNTPKKGQASKNKNIDKVLFSNLSFFSLFSDLCFFSLLWGFIGEESAKERRGM